MMATDDQVRDEPFWRFGLVFAGVMGWAVSRDLWEGGDVGALPLSAALMILTCLIGFGLLFLASGRTVPRAVRIVVPVALALFILSYVEIQYATMHLWGSGRLTDSPIFQNYAAHLFLEGENPYRFDMLEVYQAHRTPVNFSTPLIDGSLSGRLPYPALSFLLLAPFLAVGLSGPVVYPLFQIGTMVALYFGVAKPYRPLVVLPFIAEATFLTYAMIGISDAVWAFFLVCMVLAWERPLGRGLLYGLAISFKQHPWFLAPFLLVRIAWETKGDRAARLRALGLFSALSLGVFLATNLPYIVWDPAAWCRGVFEPLLAPMQVFGQGASALTTVGWVSIPRSAHLIVSWGLMGVGLVAYARHYPRFPHLLWLVPILALWFGYRSLTSYWYFLALPFALDAFRMRRSVSSDRPARRRALWPELALAGALVAGFVLAIVWAAVQPPKLEISLVGPHEVDSGRIVGTTVRVRNGTERVIEPRFQAQSGNKQPLFWIVESGPKALEPGQTALYRISGKVVASQIELRRGGRISVHPSDAFEPREAVRIEGDVSGARPDVVPNGRWALWTEGEDKPHLWALKTSPPSAGRVRYATEGPTPAVAFEVDPVLGAEFAEVVLTTFMLVPETPFSISVRPPEGANHLPDPDILFGLRLRPGAHNVWVLFGEVSAKGRFDEEDSYVVLPAPAGQWSTHEIDVGAILADMGMGINGRRMRMPGYRHLDFAMSALSVDLVLRARPDAAPLVGYFGEIVQDQRGPDPREVYRKARRRPQELILWEADYAAEMGNEEQARELYLKALDLRPGMGSVHYRVGELGLERSVTPGDVEHFLTAAELGYRPGMAYTKAGWASLRLRDPEAAESYFRDALPLLSEDAELADAWRGIALSLDRRGLCEEASDAARRAQEVAPTMRVRLPGCGIEAAPADQTPGADLNTVPAPSSP